MASIDKIYGTRKEYQKLKKWIKKYHKPWLRFLYNLKIIDTSKDNFPISNFPTYVDIALYNECPLDFVIKALEMQYEDTDTLKSDGERGDEFYKKYILC